MTVPQSSVPKTASPREGWIALPPDLVRRLGAFRRQVRRIKLFEAACAALCGVAVGFLALFLLDRVSDTPAWARGLLFAAAIVACGAIPWAWHRWVWRQRSLEQVARLIERRFPAVGDELRGIIEIVRGGGAGESKSRTLCEAAVAQVAERSARVDFRAATPPSRPWRWAVGAGVPLAAAAALTTVRPPPAEVGSRRGDGRAAAPLPRMCCP